MPQAYYEKYTERLGSPQAITVESPTIPELMITLADSLAKNNMIFPVYVVFWLMEHQTGQPVMLQEDGTMTGALTGTPINLLEESPSA